MFEHTAVSQIGGVVMRSPFIAISAFEQSLGLPVDYINNSMSVVITKALCCREVAGRRGRLLTICASVGYGSQGAWQKFERGELGIMEFYPAFGRELSDTVHGNQWYGSFQLNFN